MNPIYIFYIAVVILFSGFVVSLCAGLVYILYRFFKKNYLFDYITPRRHIFIKRIIVYSIPIITIWITFRAFFPNDRFFKEEFTDITKIDFPKKGKIVSKFADYPDFHGDYSSCARIELKTEDFTVIKKLIKSDTTFKIGMPPGSPCYESASLEEIDFNTLEGYERMDQYHHYLYIGFLDDKNIIIIFKSVT
jgi:hypothetical protein